MNGPAQKKNTRQKTILAAAVPAPTTRPSIKATESTEYYETEQRHRRSQDPPPVLQERHGHLKDHQRHGPRKLARRRTRPYDVEIDNADRRPDQTHYNQYFRTRQISRHQIDRPPPPPPRPGTCIILTANVLHIKPQGRERERTSPIASYRTGSELSTSSSATSRPWGRSSTRCTRGSPTSPSSELPERPSNAEDYSPAGHSS